MVFWSLLFTVHTHGILQSDWSIGVQYEIHCMEVKVFFGGVQYSPVVQHRKKFTCVEEQNENWHAQGRRQNFKKRGATNTSSSEKWASKVKVSASTL